MGVEPSKAASEQEPPRGRLAPDAGDAAKQRQLGGVALFEAREQSGFALVHLPGEAAHCSAWVASGLGAHHGLVAQRLHGVADHRLRAQESFSRLLPRAALHQGKVVAIDRNERILFEAYLFDNGPDYTSEGLFRIIHDGKIGFANENGEVVIAPRVCLRRCVPERQGACGSGMHTSTDGRTQRHNQLRLDVYR